MFVCAVLVGEGLISRSDRKCLCRWNSNVDTQSAAYRKQPTLQLCVRVFLCVLVINSSSLLLCREEAKKRESGSRQKN